MREARNFHVLVAAWALAARWTRAASVSVDAHEVHVSGAPDSIGLTSKLGKLHLGIFGHGASGSHPGKPVHKLRAEDGSSVSEALTEFVPGFVVAFSAIVGLVVAAAGSCLASDERALSHRACRVQVVKEGSDDADGSNSLHDDSRLASQVHGPNMTEHARVN